MPLEVLEGRLREQWLTLPSGAQISAETARRLACDAGIVPVVLGSDREILDIGKLDHEFTTAQRRAAWYRDGGKCAFPGCCNPPSSCTTSSGAAAAAPPASITPPGSASSTTGSSTKAAGPSNAHRSERLRMDRTPRPTTNPKTRDGIAVPPRATRSQPPARTTPDDPTAAISPTDAPPIGMPAQPGRECVTEWRSDRCPCEAFHLAPA